jgi:hypothetical protein
MFRHVSILFVEQIQGFSIEHEILVVDRVGEFPALGVQVDLLV